MLAPLGVGPAGLDGAEEDNPGKSRALYWKRQFLSMIGCTDIGCTDIGCTDIGCTDIGCARGPEILVLSSSLRCPGPLDRRRQAGGAQAERRHPGLQRTLSRPGTRRAG